MATVGHFISSQHPDFDPRNHGFAKLSRLIEATTLFELKREASNGAGAVYIRRHPGNKGQN